MCLELLRQKKEIHQDFSVNELTIMGFISPCYCSCDTYLLFEAHNILVYIRKGGKGVGRYILLWVCCVRCAKSPQEHINTKAHRMLCILASHLVIDFDGQSSDEGQPES